MVAGGKAQQERDPRPHLGQIDEAGGVIRLSPACSKTLVGRILPISQPIAEALARRRARRDPVRLEFVVRPPLGAGPSPGSGRSNGHCSARHGPPCVRRRRSTACGPSTTRGCVPRWRRPDARRHATLPQSWIQRENWEFETHTSRRPPRRVMFAALSVPTAGSSKIGR